MDLDEVIRQRRMCRSFLRRAVEPAVVDRLLEQARRAPSAGHTQGWAWLVLEGAEQTGRFWAVDAEPAWLARPTHPGLLRAPVILIPLADPSAYQRRYAEADKAGLGRPGGRRRSATGPTPTLATPALAVPTLPAPTLPGATASAPTPPGATLPAPTMPGATLPAPTMPAATMPGAIMPAATPPPAAPVAGGEGTAADRPVPWWGVDLSFAVMTVLLGAAAEGLGALFFALHGDPDDLRREFAVPPAWRPLGAVALGWPAPDAAPSSSAGRGRRPWADVVHRGGW